MTINAGFAVYDGHKAYKTGRGGKGVANKTTLDTIGGEKFKLVRSAASYIIKGQRAIERYNTVKHYGRTPTPKVRKAILKRDNYTCQYCGDRRGPFEADHSPSLKRHYYQEGYRMSYEARRRWANDRRNLKTACRTCNRSKGAKAYPTEWP
jgi:5-methylcytosine-specific restriction endonuclease McrA